MHILETRHLWGPNVWHRQDVLDARVRVPDADAVAVAARFDAATDIRSRLWGPFPGDGPAAVVWGRLVAQVALALQSLARGPDTRFFHVAAGPGSDHCRLALESRDPALVAECLDVAGRLLRESIAGRPDLDGLVDRLVTYADDVCLGPSTTLIVTAARARGIPWRRMSELSLVQLGQGARQRRIWTAETDATPAIAEAISRNKQLTKRLLDAAGVPVPRGRLARSAAEAWEAAAWVGIPFVVKPLDGNHGRGVFLNLRTREEVDRCFPIALAECRPGSPVIVEQFVPGVEHRLLVVAGRMIAAVAGEYLYVTGDGRGTIADLIESQINSDTRRGRSETLPTQVVEIDPTVLAELAQQDATPETVPAVGRRVLVCRMGGHGADVTDQVHPEIAAVAVRAARTVGLDVAGIDLVCLDIARPLAEQGAKVCEVNAGPQLLMHAHPKDGPGQPVGSAIVDSLFAPGVDGRIPVVAVTGAAAAEVALLLDRILRAHGLRPATTCAAGKWVAGWPCRDDDHATPTAARDVLMSPEIDAAVCELHWRAIAREGLPSDRIDLLVVLPITAEATGIPGVDDPDGSLRVLFDAIPPGGTIVLADPGLISPAAAGRRLIAAAGCSAPQRVQVVDGCAVHECDGTAPVRLAERIDPAAERIVTAALAAAVALGVPAETIGRVMADGDRRQ